MIGLAVLSLASFIIIDMSKSNPDNNSTERIEYTGSIHEIISEDYNRWILLHKTTDPQVTESIRKYLEVQGILKDTLIFGISEQDDWVIVDLDPSLNFYDYHNLTNWFQHSDPNSNGPKHIFGYARHKRDSLESYLFYADLEIKNGDTQIGSFKKGDSFFVYLPEAYDKLGNLKVTKQIDISMNEKLESIRSQGLDLSDFHSIIFTEQPYYY